MLFKYFITVSILRHIHPDIYIYSTTSAHRFVNFVKLRCCCQNQNLIAVLQLIYFCQERVHHLQVFAICRANKVNVLKPKNNDLISCLTVLSLSCLKHLFNYINLLIASNQVFRLHHYRVLFDEPHLCEHLLNHQSLTDPLGPMDQHPFDPTLIFCFNCESPSFFILRSMISFRVSIYSLNPLNYVFCLASSYSFKLLWSLNYANKAESSSISEEGWPSPFKEMITSVSDVTTESSYCGSKVITLNC